LEVFSQASVEELYSLASIAQEVDFAPQQVVFHEEDIGDAFYLIVSGRIECLSEARGVHKSFGPGEAVGLYSVLTREPRHAVAKAVEDTFALSLGAEDLYSLLSNNMEIVASIFKHFINQLGLVPRE
jgi:CRP-like cAMP-binding protein